MKNLFSLFPSSPTQKFVLRLSAPASPWRLDLGLLGSALLAWYVPLLFIIATTGMWKGGLRMWVANSLCMLGLMALNAVGIWLNRVLQFGILCATLVAAYEVWFVSRTMGNMVWQSWVAQLIVPPLVVWLNAFLFSRYQAVFGE